MSSDDQSHVAEIRRKLMEATVCDEYYSAGALWKVQIAKRPEKKHVG